MTPTESPLGERSPAFVEYSVARLRITSLFMFAHMSVPTMLALEQAILERKVSGDTAVFADSMRMWTKFREDITPHEFHELCNEMWLCRAVDTFNKYLADMLFVVFLRRPETLKSSETVRVVDVLKWNSLDEIVHYLAERKIDTLGYQSFDDLLTYLRTGLGLPLALAQELVNTIREAIHVRNLIVHNGRIVNATFAKRARRTDLTQGTPFPLTLDYVIDAIHAMTQMVTECDCAFISHFHLKFSDLH